MARLIVTIALVIFVGVVQIALGFYALNAGSINRWGGTIVIVGVVFNVAIIAYTMTRSAGVSTKGRS